MAELSHLFSGDFVIETKELSKTLDRLEREGFAFETQEGPDGRLVLICTKSPHDAYLSIWKEFRHDP